MDEDKGDDEALNDGENTDPEFEFEPESEKGSKKRSEAKEPSKTEESQEGEVVEQSDDDKGRLEEEGSDVSEREDEDDPRRKKRHKKASKRREADHEKDSKRKKRQRVREYYSGAFFGCPSACLSYELSQQLNKDSNDLLWMAIVGLTSQYLDQNIDTEAYNSLVEVYQEEVLHKNTDRPRTYQLEDGTVVPTAEEGKLEFEQEYRFMLHRHWSLYESMYHSNYVAAKLGIWRASGRAALDTMLAKMGISLRESQQRFSFMSHELREKLKNKILAGSEEFGLDDILYGSFKRVYGFKIYVSASDVAYSLKALLQSPSVLNKNLVSDIEDRTAIPRDLDAHGHLWRERWYFAYSAIAGRKATKTLLDHGITESMALQKSIVRLGIGIIEKKSIIRVKHFRYTFLQIIAEEDEKLFTQPQALSDLALFLIDVHRESGKWTGPSALPLILLSLNEKKNSYTVVAATCPEHYGEVLKNKFGTAFALAADEAEARFEHDGFQSSVISIGKEDVYRFVESLHNVLDA